MMGVHHPVMSMEHQYFLTEPIQGIVDFGKRVPLLRCPIDDFYSRQEKKGLLVGFYEQDCKTWGMDGIDPNFVNALCPVGYRPRAAGAGKRLQADAGAGRGGHPHHRQRPDHLHHRRRTVGRPDPRQAQRVLHHRPARRASAKAAVMAGCWPSRSCMARRCYDTWVIDPRRFTGHTNVELVRAEGDRGLSERIPLPLPARTPPRRAPAEDHAADADPCRRGRRVHRGQRLGAGGLHQAVARFPPDP